MTEVQKMDSIISNIKKGYSSQVQLSKLDKGGKQALKNQILKSSSSQVDVDTKKVYDRILYKLNLQQKPIRTKLKHLFIDIPKGPILNNTNFEIEDILSDRQPIIKKILMELKRRKGIPKYTNQEMKVNPSFFNFYGKSDIY